MLKATHFIFLLFWISNASCFFNDTFAAGELLYKVVQQLKTIPSTSTNGDLYSEAVQQVKKFRNQLETLNSYIPPESDPLEELKVNSTDEIKRMKEQEEIETIISSINYRFNDFYNLLEQDQKGVRWPVFVNIFLLHLREWMEALHSMIIPLKAIDLWDDGVFNLIAHWRRDHRHCGDDNKVQDFLIGLYKRVILTETKIILVLAFIDAYQTESMDHTRIKLQHRDSIVVLNEQLLAYTKALSSSLETVNSSYFKYCDPSYNSWIKDVSSFELTGFLQQVMFRYSTPFCSYSCGDIWNKRSCERGWFNERSGCNDGLMLSCEWLDEVWACLLKEGPRKYQWVHSSQLGQFGNDSNTCPEGGWIRTNMRSGHLPERACHCQCVGFQWKVYVGQLESRESDNYVITGVRFSYKKQRQDNILFLQPAQGKLQANGYIADYEWIDLPNSIPRRDIARLEPSLCTFFLDNLQLGPEHVMTGIRFQKVLRGTTRNIRGFAIGISGRPLDYRTGKLDLTHLKERVIRALPSGIEKELKYKRVRPLDTEIFERKKSSSVNFTYVKIQQSDLVDDYGQSTLPLFDSTPVVMKRHSPLNGIAIFHKGSEDNAGFISVKLRPISYLPYLKELIEIYQKNATSGGDGYL